MSFCGWGGEKYKNHFEDGVYKCSKCKVDLFYSGKKYKDDSPWPSFLQPVSKDCLSYHPESSTAIKVRCKSCGQGLGHQFIKDGPNGADRF